MQFELINGADAFEALSEEWDDLAGRGMTDTPFQSLAYQKAWWQHLHPEGSSLHTIVVRDEADDLAAIACLFLLDGTLYFNGCVEETDYLDLICTKEIAEAAWTVVFDCLYSESFPAWKTLDFCNVPQDSLTRTILPRLAHGRKLAFSETVHEVCPVIQLPATFEEYLDSLPKKQRHEIRRKLRRAHGADVQIRTIAPEDDLDQAVDDFLDLLQKSTIEKRDWLNEGRRAVFHDTARAAQKAGTLQLMFVEVGDAKAAALFNFHYKGRIWVYNSGLDPEAFGSLSLGVVVTAKAIEAAIERCCLIFDFLRGSETYKYRFGAQDTTVYRLEARRQA